MKAIKTSELEGAALDWAVAQSEGIHGSISLLEGNWLFFANKHYCPSTDWSQGGPLIEKHKVTISDGYGAAVEQWKAAVVIWLPDHDEWEAGSTPLVAACKAIVADKLGDTVEVPGELV